MTLPYQKTPAPGDLKIKIGKSDLSQIFIDIMILTCLCLQINNTVAFSNHTIIKRIKNSKQKPCPQ